MAQRGAIVTSKNIWNFDPRTVGSCVLWLDGADLNTLFQDTAATTPVTANGQSVKYWGDKSGQGNNATTFTGTNITGFPSYSSSPTGVTFTSASSVSGQGMYSVLSSSSNIASGFAVLIDSNLSPSYASTIIGGTASGPTANSGGRQWRINANALQMNNGGISSGQTATLNAFISNRGLVNFVDTGATPLSYYQFGTQLTTAGTYNGTYTASRNTTIGCRGGGTGYSEFLNGTILELIIYNSAIGTQSRQAIEGYLAWKWGLQSNISATHPYNSSVGTIVRPFSRYFSPVDIPGCALWMDAGDTTAVQLIGSTVSSIADKSGNGLTMTATSTRPAYVSNAQNGLSAIDFSLGSSYLSTSTTNFEFGTSDFSFCSSRKLHTTSSGLYPIVSKNYGNTTNSWLLWRNNASSFQVQSYSSSTFNVATSPANVVANTWFIGSATANRSGNNLLAFANDSSGSAAAITTSTNNVGSLAIQIGGTSTGSMFGGQIGELLIYSGTVTTAQRQQLQAYLAWKWGIRSSFSSTFPLYTIPSNSLSFAPKNITGCVLWLDGNDISTLFQDTAGTIPVTANGQSVALWKDKSGNTDNGTQSTGGNQPTYSSNSVTFSSASSQFLTMSSPSTLPGGATPTGTYFSYQN
jgi:hypothetical protein